MTYPVNMDPDLGCMECGKKIELNDPYSERLVGHIGGEVDPGDFEGAHVVELICVSCATKTQEAL